MTVMIALVGLAFCASLFFATDLPKKEPFPAQMAQQAKMKGCMPRQERNRSPTKTDTAECLCTPPFVLDLSEQFVIHTV